MDSAPLDVLVSSPFSRRDNMHLLAQLPIGAGALIGPTIGGSIWRFTHRRVLMHIDAKDREFFRRIAKNRVDVSLQNPTQPVPDYYGV